MDPPVAFYFEYEDFQHRWGDTKYRQNLARLRKMWHLYPHTDYNDVYPTLYLRYVGDSFEKITAEMDYELHFIELESCINSAIFFEYHVAESQGINIYDQLITPSVKAQIAMITLIVDSQNKSLAHKEAWTSATICVKSLGLKRLAHPGYLQYTIEGQNFYVYATWRVVAVLVINYNTVCIEHPYINFRSATEFVRVNIDELSRQPPNNQILTYQLPNHNEQPRTIPGLYSALTSKIMEFMDARSVACMSSVGRGYAVPRQYRHDMIEKAEIASIFNHCGVRSTTSLAILANSGATQHIRYLSRTAAWPQEQIDSAFIIAMAHGYRETMKALRDCGARLPSLEEIIESGMHLGWYIDNMVDPQAENIIEALCYNACPVIDIVMGMGAVPSPGKPTSDLFLHMGSTQWVFRDIYLDSICASTLHFSRDDLETMMRSNAEEYSADAGRWVVKFILRLANRLPEQERQELYTLAGQ